MSRYCSNGIVFCAYSLLPLFYIILIHGFVVGGRLNRGNTVSSGDLCRRSSEVVVTVGPGNDVVDDSCEVLLYRRVVNC